MTVTFRQYAERQNARRPEWPLALGRLRSRVARWIVVTAKKAYPAVVVLGGCAALVAATIALRLAIWLPLYFHP